MKFHKDAKGHPIIPGFHVIASPEGAPYVMDTNGIRRFYPASFFGEHKSSYVFDDAENSGNYLIVGNTESTPQALKFAISDAKELIVQCESEYCQRPAYIACQHCAEEETHAIVNV